MTATVLFPWRRGCPFRDAGATWIMRQWATHHPDIPQATTGDTPDDGPWCKGRHVNRLTAQAPDGILIVSDVDVWTTPDAIQSAVNAVQTGAPWAIPHGDVYRLTQQATTEYVTAAKPDLWRLDVTEPPYPGHPGGGLVVLSRETALTVPMDPRFEGWGQEDDAWGLALTTLTGKPWRGTIPLIHLWHPPAPRMTRQYGTRTSLALYDRYQAAARRPGRMRALLDEISASQQKPPEPELSIYDLIEYASITTPHEA